jgi:hypothetical protein
MSGMDRPSLARWYVAAPTDPIHSRPVTSDRISHYLWLRLVLSAVLVAACGNEPAPTIAAESPVDAALATFRALNTGEMSLAAAHWVPGRGGRVGQDVPPRDVFQNVQCRPGQRHDGGVGDTATDAGVSCEFDIREMWGGFSAGHWEWGVFLRRQPPGPWLIYDWGQG